MTIEQLIEEARKIPVTPEMRRAHAISFVHGNLQLDGCEATREMVAVEYDRLHPTKCAHDRLDEDGICRECGTDRRGI